MKIFIVIAAFNEEQRIGIVLKELKKNGYKNIVVVDDGSTDNTYEIAKKQTKNVLKNKINQGQGASLRKGIKYALKNSAEIIITYDADGQFKANEIKNIIKPIIKENIDIVLGSRFLNKKPIKIPFFKKIMLKIGVFIAYCLYGITITDSQCGLRSLSKKAAKEIEIFSDRMEHAADFFSEIKKKNLTYKEIPVTVIYDDYSIEKGQKWMDAFPIGMKMVYNKIIRKK